MITGATTRPNELYQPATISRWPRRPSAGAGRGAAEEERRYQITTLHPTTYSEARTIGEHFRDGHPVIMNLTEMDEADAKRLVDFAAGLAFGLRGNIERVTNRVFLLSPANIQVTEEDKAKIAEGGFFEHPSSRPGTAAGVSIVLQVLPGALPFSASCFSAVCHERRAAVSGGRWRPGRGAAAAALEVVWSVTDPPLKALRRVIPPLRIGTVASAWPHFCCSSSCSC